MTKEREAKNKERERANKVETEERLRQAANTRSGKYKMESGPVQQESSRQPLSGYVVGPLLILAGVITTAACMGMDVSSGSTHEGAAIANLDRMNQRLGGVVIGVGLFVAGVVLAGMWAIHATLAFTAQVIMRANQETRDVHAEAVKAQSTEKAGEQ
jgi:hypothetical protein